MGKPLSILNIGGHPKDCILYAGGTMALHASRGDRVCMLTPTTGLSHHLEAIDEYRKTGIMPDMDFLVEGRRQELVDACQELGISDVRFLGYEDDIPVIEKQIVNDIADVIGEIQPNIIVTHWPYDTVQAHAMATQMTMLAIEAAACIRPGKPAPVGGDTGTKAHIFYHSQQGRTNVLENLAVRIPTTVIDISSVMKQKSRAMNVMKSQHYGEDSPLQRKLGESLDGDILAIHSRVAYAESFVSHLPQVHKYLPISEYENELRARPSDEAFKSWTSMVLDEY